MKRKLLAAALAVGLLAGCGTESSRISHNVSQEADNFNVTRRLAVINTITDSPQLELVGNFSIKVDAADSQLEITVKEGEDLYRKHFVGLSETVTYIVEDISGADVSAHRYQISYLPEAIIPVSFKRGSDE